SSIHRGTEQNLRVVADMAIKLLHNNFDFGQRHARAACHLYQNPCRIRQGATTVHQWTFERLGECVVREVLRIGFPKTKQATAVATAQGRNKIVKTDANEAWSLN